MASRGYMGPSEVQALIGQWVDIIGKDRDDDDHDRDRDRGDRDRDRGDRGRDRGDHNYWKKNPPWWRGSNDQWKQLPDWQKQQLWQQGGYPGGQQWPPPGYPQQPPYGQQTPPAWWQSQPAWWRQQNPWFQGMPWQPQQQAYPTYGQPPYGQPPYQPPYGQQPYQPQPSTRPGYHWVPAYGSTPGHWERERAYSSTPSYGPAGGGPVVREHRAGYGGSPGGGVSVTASPRQRGVQNLTGPGISDYFSNLFSGTGTISGNEYDVGHWAPYPHRHPHPFPLPPAYGAPLIPYGRPFLGADPDGAQMVFPPRAALVEAPAPTQANRDILPMSTGVPILPTQSAQITGRPQCRAYRVGCYKISNAGTAGGAADWIVNDIKIGNQSQFVQSGDVPGDIFATNAIDTFVRFETAQTAMDVVVVVTYIGLNESGCPFFSAMIGTAAI